MHAYKCVYVYNVCMLSHSAYMCLTHICTLISAYMCTMYVCSLIVHIFVIAMYIRSYCTYVSNAYMLSYSAYMCLTHVCTLLSTYVYNVCMLSYSAYICDSHLYTFIVHICVELMYEFSQSICVYNAHMHGCSPYMYLPHVYTLIVHIFVELMYARSIVHICVKHIYALLLSM